MRLFSRGYGQRLRELRLAKQVKQRELARFLQVPQCTISRLESQGVAPTWEMACRIAAALECSLDDFVFAAEPALTA